MRLRCHIICPNFLFFKNGPTPRPLFNLFSVFLNKQYNFYYKSMWKNVMSIQYPVLNSNPRPLEYESPPITTRPGPHPKWSISLPSLVASWYLPNSLCIWLNWGTSYVKDFLHCKKIFPDFSPPAHLSVTGLYDVDFRIVAACRNGTLCTLKRGWNTARTVAVLESQVQFVDLVTMARSYKEIFA